MACNENDGELVELFTIYNSIDDGLRIQAIQNPTGCLVITQYGWVQDAISVSTTYVPGVKPEFIKNGMYKLVPI